ncbi:MAG: glycogen/starch synthase [Paracoccaceae bacterium]
MRLFKAQVGTTTVLALDAPHLYHRDGGPYAGKQGDYWDNPERFAALSWAAAEVARDGWATAGSRTCCMRMTGRPVWRRPICATTAAAASRR